ncbi:MAG: Ig-like domain-containing protein [Faecousia sp.]
MSWTSETRQNYGGTITWLTSGILLRSLELDRSYVTLPVDDSLTLNAAVDSDIPVEIRWSVEDEIIATVSENGTVTALNAGTTYVIASVAVDDVTLSARCRVDVTAEASETAVTGVQLGTSAVTTELFKTDYAEFDVILLLDQNRNPVSSALSAGESRVVPEDNGVAVASAKFADAATAALFDLAVKDDRTLLVVPKADTIANAQTNPRSIAGSYTSKVVVTVGEETFTTDTALNLTVKNSIPKLNAAALTFNPFYTGQSQVIQITGATVKAITEVTLPSWLDLNDGVLALGDDVPTKGSYTAVVSVQTEEWVNPVTTVSVPVKLAYAAPKLKLSASSVTLPTFTKPDDYGDYGAGQWVQLLCKNKQDTLESLNVSYIEAPDGWHVTRKDDGWFFLKPAEGKTVEPGKITLKVHFSDTDSVVELPLTIKTKLTPLLIQPRLPNLSYKLSSTVLDGFFVPWYVSPQYVDLSRCELSWRILDKFGNNVLRLEDPMFNTYIMQDGRLAIWTKPGVVEPGTYKLYIDLWDNEAEQIITEESAVMTFTVMPENKKPIITAKVNNAIDLSFPDPSASIAFSKSNYFIMNFENYTQIGKEAIFTNALGQDVTEQFTFIRDDSISTWVIRPNGEVPTGTYKLDFDVVLDYSSPNGTVHCPTTFTVKRTPIKLKLSKTSLSLNKKINDSAAVDVTCLTKGYDFQAPVLTVPEGLTAEYRDGKLLVSTNGKTLYGATYKILVQAAEKAPAATLTVKIPDAYHSNVTASLKAKGAIDVVRDGTYITVTPSYKNYMGLSGINPSLTIQSSGNKWKTFTDVTDSFVITPDGNGAFLIAKGSDVQVDTALKYRAKLTFNGGNTPAYVNLAVKSGTAKVAVSGTPVLYKADRFSRDTFRLTAADKTLNSIVKAAIKDAKYQGIFEVYSYGNGEFAIGFKGNKVPNGKLPSSVVLNVYADGNLAKSVASVTLKVQIQ